MILEKINDRKNIDARTIVSGEKLFSYLRRGKLLEKINKREKHRYSYIYISGVSFFACLIIREKIRAENAAKLKAPGRNEQ